jgi:hypothetical protein
LEVLPSLLQNANWYPAFYSRSHAKHYNYIVVLIETRVKSFSRARLKYVLTTVLFP